jgi:hypothetical protein
MSTVNWRRCHMSGCWCIATYGVTIAVVFLSRRNDYVQNQTLQSVFIWHHVPAVISRFVTILSNRQPGPWMDLVARAIYGDPVISDPL